MGIALISFLGFILVCNLILMVKSTINPKHPPMVFGIMPMAVNSGSMSGDAADHIEVDDLIFVSDIDHKELKVGNIIAYFCADNTIVTHRIISIETNENNEMRFITKGDANNISDEPVTMSRIIGIYKFRIPKIGKAVILLQTPIGMVLSFGVPILIYFAIGLVCRKGKKKRQ